MDSLERWNALRRRLLYPSELRARNYALLILNHFGILKLQKIVLPGAENCINTVNKISFQRGLNQNGPRLICLAVQLVQGLAFHPEHHLLNFFEHHRQQPRDLFVRNAPRHSKAENNGSNRNCRVYNGRKLASKMEILLTSVSWSISVAKKMPRQASAHGSPIHF